MRIFLWMDKKPSADRSHAPWKEILAIVQYSQNDFGVLGAMKMEKSESLT